MILVTGGAGSMGVRLVRRLVALGQDVRVIGLPGDSRVQLLEKLGAQFAPADIRDPEALGKVFEGIDRFVHLAALILSRKNPDRLHDTNVEGTRHLLAAAKTAGVLRMIHVSSISVEYRFQNSYSLSKRLAEDLVRQSGLDWTILRPTLAWGDSSAVEYASFARAVERFPLLPLPGGGKALKSPVHLDDLVGAFERSLFSRTVSGATLALPGPDRISLAEMARRIRLARQRKGATMTVPALASLFFVRLHARAWRAMGIEPWADRQTWTGFVENAVPAPDPALRALGWTPRPFDPRHDGLAKGPTP